tara:strand:- start:1261 stop:1521 length:261 start_codon:yes stop_codon:yes gene_type:complete
MTITAPLTHEDGTIVATVRVEFRVDSIMAAFHVLNDHRNAGTEHTVSDFEARFARAGVLANIALEAQGHHRAVACGFEIGPLVVQS